MCADEFHKDSLVPVGNMDNEPKFVAAQIKDQTIIRDLQLRRIAPWRPPVRTSSLKEPVLSLPRPTRRRR
jgi:hypothetical protein